MNNGVKQKGKSTFINIFKKKKTPGDDSDSVNSLNGTFKTGRGYVETDSIPQPPRPPSLSDHQSHNVKLSPRLNQKQKGGASQAKSKLSESPPELGQRSCGPEDESDDAGSRKSGPYIPEDQHEQQTYPGGPSATINVTNITGNQYVRIGNNVVIGSRIVYDYGDRRRTSSSEPKAKDTDDEEDPRQEVLDQIKKGFRCMDNLTDEDKTRVKMNFSGKWQTLAAKMGYSQQEIEKWEKDRNFPRNKSEAIGKLLEKWEKDLGATVGALCVILQACNELRTAHLLALAHG